MEVPKDQEGVVGRRLVYSNVPPISARADGHNGCPACARVPRASARREAGVHGGVLSFRNGGFKFVYFRSTITRLVF